MLSLAISEIIYIQQITSLDYFIPFLWILTMKQKIISNF